MKIAVVGSRSITDVQFVEKYLEIAITNHVPIDQPVTILSGGAKGVDTIAQNFAKGNGHDFILFKPYHLIDRAAEYTPRYFFTRNKQIADNADLVIAFFNPDGKSNGTRHIISYCRKEHKALLVVEPEPGDMKDEK